MAEDILRNVNAVVDGRGYAGKIDELVLPKLELMTEELRGGGMDAPDDIDMGMQKLVASIQTHGFDADLLRRFGVRSGGPVQMTFRGALQSEDGRVKAAVAALRGKITLIEPGTWKAGQRSPLKATMTCRYYKLEIDSETIHEIDLYRYIRIIDGVDQVQQLREALAIAGDTRSGVDFV